MHYTETVARLEMFLTHGVYCLPDHVMYTVHASSQGAWFNRTPPPQPEPRPTMVAIIRTTIVPSRYLFPGMWVSRPGLGLKTDQDHFFEVLVLVSTLLVLVLKLFVCAGRDQDSKGLGLGCWSWSRPCWSWSWSRTPWS